MERQWIEFEKIPVSLQLQIVAQYEVTEYTIFLFFPIYVIQIWFDDKQNVKRMSQS